MNKDNRTTQFDAASDSAGPLEALVERAFSELATRSDEPGGITDALAEAVLSDDPDARTTLVSELIAAGLPVKDVISVHAVDAARRLGVLWGDNHISFVDVTIGTARLQETVRKLSRRGVSLKTPQRRPSILLCPPPGEDHVFGAVVAASEFEDAGCRVTLALGYSAAEIEEIYRGNSFDMVGLSVASRRNVNAIASLVRRLRAAPKVTPIVLGGSLTLSPDFDIEAATGVDHVCPDAATALRTCGIDLPSQATTREETAINEEKHSKGDVS